MMSIDHRLRVVCVAPFNNPHITSIYDALAEREDLSVVRIALRQLPNARIELGWEEFSDDSNYLCVWKRKLNVLRYVRELIHADVVVLPGFHVFWSLPLQHYFCRFLNKPVLFWTEAFVGHHSRSRFVYRCIRFLNRFANSRDIHVLAMGGYNAATDTASVSCCNLWSYWSFGYAVEPIMVRDEVTISRRLKFVFVGGLNERKCVDLLLHAISSLAGQWEFELDLIGDGDERANLQVLTDRLGLSSIVRFNGAMARSQIPLELPQYDVLILPSRFDGWGAVVNEAMECGLGVIVSDGAGASMLLNNGNCGRVFRHNDVESLRGAIRHALESPHEVLEWKRAAKEVVKLYRPSHLAASLCNLIRSIIDGEPFHGVPPINQVTPEIKSLCSLMSERSSYH